MITLYAIRHPKTGYWLLFNDDGDYSAHASLNTRIYGQTTSTSVDGYRIYVVVAYWTERLISKHFGNYEPGMRDVAVQVGGELVAFDVTPRSTATTTPAAPLP